MLKEVQLPFYPSATNCLAWSKDGELAVTAGEHVHLLVPERKATAKSKGIQDADPWAAVRFRVNGFTTDEWPMQEPSSFADFSIGEEQSMSTVSALSWSAPGLGKHRRSVLAVLTSNLVLSIWESKSDPKEQESWERALVVNHSLRDYFSSHDDNINAPDIREGSLRRRTRIRASAWAEPLRWEGSHGPPSYQSKWGMFLLAVTNDNGEIIILRIVNPYSMEVGQSGKWDAMIWWHGKDVPATQAESQAARPVQQSVLSAIMTQKFFVQDLVWSSWMYSENHYALLTYKWAAQVYSLKVSFFRQPVHITTALDCGEEFASISNLEPVHTSTMTPNNCPMLSCSYKQADDSGVSTHITAIAARDTINICVVSVDSEMHTHNRDVYKHQLEAKLDRWMPAEDEANVVPMHPWDQVSGLALCKEPDATEFYLYITTHLSHLEALKYTPSGEPRWSTCVDTVLQNRMSDCRMRFDHGHDLGGLSVMKTWGLASLGSYVAACVTVHPGDMVEYTIQSVERSTIVFGETEDQDRRFPWELVTEHAATEAEAQGRILDTTLAGEKVHDGKERSVLTNRIVYAAACASMRLWDAGRSERLERAKKALRTLESVTGFAFASEIACIERLLTMKGADPDKQASEIKNFTRHVNMDHYPNTTAASRIHEMCSICGESIVWDSLDAARCFHGHAFVRCALTFLTIQEPGISKYCESCDREYLDEQVLLDPAKHVDGRPEVETQELSVGVSQESTSIYVEGTHDSGSGMPAEKEYENASLARVLFSTYDVCVYCGGKFVG